MILNYPPPSPYDEPFLREPDNRTQKQKDKDEKKEQDKVLKQLGIK